MKYGRFVGRHTVGSACGAVAPMGAARRNIGLAVMRGKLFVVGGWSNGNGVLATAEAYDPQHDRWEAVAPLASARGGLALVAA